MGRRGRSMSPPPARRRVASPPPPAPRAAAAAPPAHVQAAPSAVAPVTPMQPQQPGMLAGMAQMAGGIAGGHLIYDGVRALVGGGGSGHGSEVAQAAPAAAAGHQPSYAASESQGGACAWEMKQFLQCAQEQADITLCQGFNEALRQCKQAHGAPMQ